MRRALWKWFINYEKEERWLNEMSARGFALTDFFFCRYTFEDSLPGEYTYRIELLEHIPSHPESQRYINFLEENSAEHIASWHRWVYFRRKSEDGPFYIYSDIDSRIAHYKRVGTLYLCVGIAEICVGAGQLGIIHSNIKYGYPFTWFSMNLFILALLWSLGAVLLLMWNRLRKRNKVLKQEKNVWE